MRGITFTLPIGYGGKSVRVSSVDVLYLKGEGSYTWFYLSDGQVLLQCYRIKRFQRILPHFLHIKKGTLVNPEHIKEASRKGAVGPQNGYVTLNNGKYLEVSRRRVAEIWGANSRFAFSRQ